MLVTPLTRRSFGSDGVHKNDLIPWADAIGLVARNTSTTLVELNAKSAAAVAAMGAADADTLAEEPPGNSSPSRFDHTHLGEKGAAFFAAMVARELAQLLPDFESNIQQEKLAR